MWKKRFVTRLTRMGLSTYLLMFCLSFTVCAEEYPLNDLIVPEFSEISSGIEEEEIFEDGEEAAFFEEINNPNETEPGIGEDIGTNQTDIGFNRTNNTIEEEIEDEPYTGPGMNESITPKAISFNVTEVMINDKNEPASVMVTTVSGLPDFDPGNLSFCLSENKSSFTGSETLYGVTISVDDEKKVTLDARETEEGYEGRVFYLVAKYSYYEDGQNKEKQEAIAVMVGEPGAVGALTICSDGQGSSDTVLNITDPVNADQYFEVSVYAKTPAGMNLDASKVSWRVYEGETEVTEDVLTDVYGDEGTVNATLSFRNISAPGEHTLNITAYYQNSYWVGYKYVSREDTAPVSCIVRFTREDDGVSLHFMTDNLTVYRSNIFFDGALNVFLQNGGVENYLLPSDRMTYGFRRLDNTKLFDSLYGLTVIRTDEGWTLNTTNLDRSADFYVVARYQSDDRVYQALLPVRGCVRLSGIRMKAGEGTQDEGNLLITDHSSDTPLRLSVEAASPEGVIPDPDRISWSVYEIGDGGTQALLDEEALSERGINMTTRQEVNGEIRNLNAEPVISFEGLTSPGEFLFTAEYNNTFIELDGSVHNYSPVNCSCRVSVVTGSEDYCYDVTNLSVGRGANMTISSRGNRTVAITSAESLLSGAIEPGDLDPSRIVWGLINADSINLLNLKQDELMDVKIIPGKDNRSCVLSFENVDCGGTIDLIAVYFNKGNLSTWPDEETTDWVIGRCRLNVEIENPYASLEAHLPKKSGKIDLYRTKNEIRISVRSKNASVLQEEYEIVEAGFTNSSLEDCLSLSVTEDGRTLNVAAKKDLVDNTTAMKDLLKKKAATGIRLLIVRSGGDPARAKEFLTENMTLTFEANEPKIKAGKLSFNSYLADAFDFMGAKDEVKSPVFTGAVIGRFEAADPAGLPKGFRIVNRYEYAITITKEIPAVVKKGSIKLRVFPEDPAYNLPENYNTTVTVNYEVKNNPPKFSLSTKSVTLNAAAGDYQEINFTLTGKPKEAAIVYGFTVFDPKGRECASDRLPFEILNSYDEINSRGSFRLSPTSYAEAGKTYKVKVYSYNEFNEQKGGAATVSVKILSAADSKKAALTVSGKGTLDVSRPGTPVTYRLKGKNLNLFNRSIARFRTTINGTDYTDAFDYSFDQNTGVLKISEKDSTYFRLLNLGLAGSTAVTEVVMPTADRLAEDDALENNNVTLTIRTKITQTAVTPKSSIKKVVLNPDYDNSNVISIPITNLPADLYGYKVDVTGLENIDPYSLIGSAPGINGNGTGPLVPLYTLNTTDDGLHDILEFDNFGYEMLSELSGKTCKIRITPTAGFDPAASLKAGTLTVTVQVLDPKKPKNAVKISASAKGKIDAVRDETYVTVTLSAKNLYDLPGAMSKAPVVESVNLTVKKKSYDRTELFDWEVNGRKIVIRRKDGKDLPAGTYKAAIRLTLRSGEGEKEFRKTVSFKVVRGKKTKSAISPKTLTLVNYEFDRSGSFTVTVGDHSVNDIEEVTLGGNYGSKYSLTKVSDGVYRLSSAPGYVEKSGNKLISKMLTRKNIPIKIRYKGSTVCDTLKLTVIMLP